MALKATVRKLALSISDMDRNYYASHALTLAQHPSETDLRLMARVVAFALHADERLEFGRGVSADDEADLWRRDLTGQIEQWIELGHPDESRVRRAAGRAGEVVVVTYSGRAADLWWDKARDTLVRSKNLTVVDLDPAELEQLVAWDERSLDLQCLIQDGRMQWLRGDDSVEIVPRVRHPSNG